MTRFALILGLCAACATPVMSQTAPLVSETTPLPRPEGLVERSVAAAAAVAEAEAAEAAAEPVAAQAAAQDADLPDRAEIAAQITGAIRACWNVAGLSDEAMAVQIWLAFDTTEDGEVIRETIEMTRFENGTQEAAEEALVAAFAAIMRCGNDGLDLPAETHPIWQRVEILFEAASMVPQ